MGGSEVAMTCRHEENAKTHTKQCAVNYKYSIALASLLNNKDYLYFLVETAIIHATVKLSLVSLQYMDERGHMDFVK